VYRYDPASGEQTLVRTVVDHPNGLAFAPDGRTLYVADCGADHASGGIDPERPHTVSALQVRAGHIVDHLWTHTVRFGSPAGLKTDPAGRVWFTVGDGLRVLSPEGEQLGDLPLAGAVDFTFAGADDVLLVTTNTAVLAVVLDPSF
jgi:gluconolactonase